MRLKPGVRLLGIRPETWAIAFAADPLWLAAGVAGGVMISACTEGVHMRASPHYLGCALDLRVHDLPPTISHEAVRTQLADALGADFDVLLERVGTPEVHIHGEFDPKTPY